MPAPTICTISGVLMDSTNTPIAGVIVMANGTRPYIDPTSGSLIPNMAVQTTTDSTGSWQLSLIETETANIGITIKFLYVLDQTNAPACYEYTIIVPDAASANFSDLITGQT